MGSVGQTVVLYVPLPVSTTHLQSVVESRVQTRDQHNSRQVIIIGGHNVKSGWCIKLIFSGYNNSLSFQDYLIFIIFAVHLQVEPQRIHNKNRQSARSLTYMNAIMLFCYKTVQPIKIILIRGSHKSPTLLAKTETF